MPGEDPDPWLVEDSYSPSIQVHLIQIISRQLLFTLLVMCLPNFQPSKLWQLVHTHTDSLVDDFLQLPLQLCSSSDFSPAASSKPSPTLLKQLPDDETSMNTTHSKRLSQRIKTLRRRSTLETARLISENASYHAFGV